MVKFTPMQFGANELATLAFQPWKVFDGEEIARNKLWCGEGQLGRAFPTRNKEDSRCWF